MHRSFITLIALLGGILVTSDLVSCAVAPPPPPAPPPQCDGNPNWCVTAINNGDVDANVYMDGYSLGAVGGGTRRLIPVPSGDHVFQVCYEMTRGLLRIPVGKRCAPPVQRVINGNQWLVVTVNAAPAY